MITALQILQANLAICSRTGNASETFVLTVEQIREVIGWHECIAKSTLSQAARDVVAERQRQKDVEGWSSEHDDKHHTGDLAIAAACYAQASTYDDVTRSDLSDIPPPRLWPWDEAWWKPKSRRQDLVRAGALIIAEIERVDRIA